MLPGLCEGSHRASGSFRFVGTLVPTYTSGRPNYKRLLQQANGNRVLQLGSFTSRKCKFAHVLQPDRHDPGCRTFRPGTRGRHPDRGFLSHTLGGPSDENPVREKELTGPNDLSRRTLSPPYNSVLAQPELATPRSRGRDLDGRGQFRHDPEGLDLERSERDHALLGPAQRRCLAPRVWRVRRGLALHAPASAVAAARQ